MNFYHVFSARLAGAALVAGPALIVIAALLAAAGLGTTTGRWYDNWLEGILMASGYSLQLVGLLELSRRIGASRPVLGILATIASIVGSMGSIFPSAVRIFAAVELQMGFTVEQLDLLHGPSDDGTDPLLIIFPFILFFFLNYILFLPLGLWRSKTGPRFSPLLLLIGTIFFILGQSSFEVNMLAYIAGVSSWFLALAPLGFSLLLGTGSPQPSPARTVSGG